MDPCPFVRLTVGSLALKLPVASKPVTSLVHPSSSPCFCKIKLKNFPLQTAVVPFVAAENNFPDGQAQGVAAATFHLSKSDLDKVSAKTIFSGRLCLRISIYSGRRGTTCGVSAGRLLGKVFVPLDLTRTEAKPAVFHSGWIAVGRGGKSSSAAQFHLNVRSEPDPRFVFQFDGEPECSPQVFQIQGNIRQPVFTCKFSFRTPGDQRSSSLQSEPSGSRSWLGSFGSEREKPSKERKGWSVTVHDLSGSPVAAASMVTPFVASPGSDRVSRSNPGAWLILRPEDSTWKPWGRLEAWRERTDGLGYRFELAEGFVLTESVLSAHCGGKFVIDLGAAVSPASSPPGQAHGPSRGFVMSALVEGEGRCSKPTVEVGVHHVGCAEDAAAFVALSAAIDLCMDACRLFSHRLRKELCHQHDQQWP